MLSKIKSTLIGLVYFFLSCLKLEKLKSSVIQVKSEEKKCSKNWVRPRRRKKMSKNKHKILGLHPMTFKQKGKRTPPWPSQCLD